MAKRGTMDKVIKMSVTKTGRYGKAQQYQLQITEQSYIKNNFGNPNQSFISSKGFELRSANMPATSSSTKLYVRGNDTSYDDTTVRVRETLLRNIMHAVREYNSHLIIADLPVIPEENTFIIE